MLASCGVVQGASGTWATCPRNPEVFGLGAEGQGFVVEVDFQLKLSFLVVEMEYRRHRFCGAELASRTDPRGTPFLRRRNLLLWPFPGVRINLRFQGV